MTKEIKLKSEKPSKFKKVLNFILGNMVFKVAAIVCAFLVWFAVKLFFVT
ncbi:MAG: hypothetical protein FWG51_05840 [Firmicutes bacterium]|nr:hypothetical protein [Bacillota bacterium]